MSMPSSSLTEYGLRLACCIRNDPYSMTLITRRDIMRTQQLLQALGQQIPEAVRDAGSDMCSVRCYRCGVYGHIGRNCPSSAVVGQRCYECGSTGHFARDCTQRLARLRDAAFFHYRALLKIKTLSLRQEPANFRGSRWQSCVLQAM